MVTSQAVGGAHPTLWRLHWNAAMRTNLDSKGNRLATVRARPQIRIPWVILRGTILLVILLRTTCSEEYRQNANGDHHKKAENPQDNNQLKYANSSHVGLVFVSGALPTNELTHVL